MAKKTTSSLDELMGRYGGQPAGGQTSQQPRGGQAGTTQQKSSPLDDLMGKYLNIQQGQSQAAKPASALPAQNGSRNEDLFSLAQQMSTGQQQRTPVTEPAAPNAAQGNSRYLQNIFDNAEARESSLYSGAYADILNREDYAELSQAAGSKLSWMPWKNDVLYDYINNINGQREQQDLLDASHEGGQGYGKYAFMTADEIGVYNYIYATEGKRAANKFLKELEPELERQFYTGFSADLQERALEHPILYSGMTIAAQPARMATSGLALAQDAYRTFTDEEIDPDSTLRRLSRETSNIRNAIATEAENNPDRWLWSSLLSQMGEDTTRMLASDEAARWAMQNQGEDQALNPFADQGEIDMAAKGQIASFVYQTTMSAADSAVNMAVASGLADAYAGLRGLDLTTEAGINAVQKATNVIGSLIMSSEVASLGVAEAKEKGYKDQGALAVGLVRGAVEYASEAIGGDRVISNIRRNPLNFLKTMVLNMIPEGVEEVMSDAMNGAVNLIIDALWDTNESGIPALRQEFRTAGWEQNHPQIASLMNLFGWDNPDAAVILSLLGDEALSFLGGAFATVGTSAVQTRNVLRGITAVSQQLNTTPEAVVQLMEDYKTDNPGAIYDIAQLTGVSSEEQFRQTAGEGKTAAKILEELRKSGAGTAAGTAQAAPTQGQTAQQQTDDTGARYLRQVVEDMDVPEAAQKILVDGLDTGTADAQTYAHAIQEAFKLGQMGLTYEQAKENAKLNSTVNETQFRHAWEIGAQKAGQSTETKASTVRAASVPEYESIEDFSREFSSPEKVTEIFDQAADTDVNEFAAGFRAAYDMGRSGVSAHYATADNVPTLTDAQRTAAYQLGRADSSAKAQERAGRVAEKQKTGDLSRVKGTVKGEGVTIADLKKTFNDSQNRAYRLLTRYAETTGVNIVLYNSQADESTGDYPAAQGRFQWKDDTIYVDINSGLNNIRDVNDLGRYTMLRTFAHEFTHFLEKWNAQGYNEFREFVFQTLENKGENVHDLIEEKQALDESGKMTYEQASREVVADAMMDILPDSTLVQQLAGEHRTVFNKLLQKLRDFNARLKQAYREMTGKGPREAQVLKENGAYMDGIVDMWDRIAKQAVANYQGANGEAVTQAEQQKKKTRSTSQNTKTAKNETKEKAPVSNTSEAVLSQEAQQAENETAPETAKDKTVFTGESGVEYTQKQVDALAALSSETLITAAETSYTLPVDKMGITEAQADALRDAGLLNTETAEDGSTYEYLMDTYIYDERARRRKQETQKYHANDTQEPAQEPAAQAEPETPAAEETPAAPSQDTPEGARLRDMLRMTNAVTVNGFRYSVQLSPGSGNYFGRIERVRESRGAYPVANARDTVYASRGFTERSEAVGDLVRVAENNKLLKEAPKEQEQSRKGSADAFSKGDIFNEKQVKEAAENPAAREIIEKMPKAEETAKPAQQKPKSRFPLQKWKNGTPSQKAAYRILTEHLRAGKGLPSKTLYAICDEAFGGTQAEGAYNRKDAYDAMELAVNRYLLDTMARYNDGSVENALEGLAEAQKILSLLPTQSVRTQEQQDFQQFSTPPSIAYLAAWAANINSQDHVLEPSAGIGGLAAFAKAWGAEVTVNELSERRYGIIKAMGFDHYFNENAEHIDNVLPEDIRPTVVIMNPPFSSTAGRTKSNKTSNAEAHINSALDRLPQGGRLVAIVGRGMADDKYSRYWNSVRKEYTIRANIGIDGKNYTKYGTSFDVQIVVIDKTGPQGNAKTITGSYADLSQVPAVLEAVRNDRSTEIESNAPVASDSSSYAQSGEPKPVSPAMAQTDAADSGRAQPGDRSNTGRSGESGSADVQRTGGRTESVQNAGSGERGAVEQRRPDKENQRGGKPAEQNGRLRSDAGTAGAAANVQGESGQQRSGSESESARGGQVEEAVSDDGVYATYNTPPLTTTGSRRHPAVLVESAAMAAVDMPKATYTPHLPDNVVKNNLSDAQMVSVIYAGQAHEQKLPNGERRGFFIGDGTGVGKGRQISGIILDNFEQGRKKAIWISEKQSLFNDAQRDWTDTTGRSKDEVKSLAKVKVDNSIEYKDGIVFTTYDTLRGGSKTKSRVQQLADWFGKDYDGVIAFDEAHNMGNLLGKAGKRGKTTGSGKAIAAVELQRLLPNARVVYVSATAATDVDGLAFASRLGLWGKGTAFADVKDFVSKIGSAGLSAMELVIRDMKAMGMYVARSISYNSVEYSTVQHDLDPIQRQIYNKMSQAWQKTMQNVEQSLVDTNAYHNAQAKQNAIGQYYSAIQRFYNQVLTSMSMPSVIADMKKQLAAGKSCVLQIVNTNQAEADRQMASIKAEGGELDEMDLTPRGTLIDYLMKNYPIYLYEDYQDDNGNIRSRPVLNSKGEQVIDKKAVAKRDALIAEINQMSIPDGPLEMLFDAFGTENVAEITGRTRRVVPRKQADGTIKRVEESRTANSKEADVTAFQNGDKRILVFNNAGGTGKSYHADVRAKNQQQRVHYVLQPGWEASRAVQGFGRTHRSNEASAPIYKLVTTDIKGQKRFTSTIARRLDQLGALTKGQRDTGSGMFGASDNLETDLARDSLREFYSRLGRNKLEGNNGIINGKEILQKLGLLGKFTDEYGNFKMNDTDSRDISKFLNRILALEVDEQNEVFDAFINIYETEMDAAIAAGTLDRGMENVKADKIEIVDDKVIQQQEGTGASTHYVQAKVYTKPKVITTVAEAEGLRNGFQGIYRTKDGSIRAVYRIADKTTEWGSIVKQFKVQAPNRSKSSVWQESTLKNNAELLPKSQWKSAWDEEVKKVPQYNEEIKHMLTGSLLPIWNNLPEEGNTKVQRLMTDDGKAYLGRIINPDQIDNVLRRFSVNRTKETYTGKSLMQKALGSNDVFNLTYYRAKLQRSRVSGQWRLEYVQPQNPWAIQQQYPEMMMERINYQNRYFIPTGAKGEALLDKILDNNPVANVSERGEDITQYSFRAKGNGEKSRIDRALEMRAAGRSPSEIFNETGLATRGNGNLYDPETKEIVWRNQNEQTADNMGTAVGNLYGRESQGWAETEVSEYDGRGIPGGSEEGHGEILRRQWGDLQKSDREKAQRIIVDHIAKNQTDLTKGLIERMTAGELAERIYGLYAQGGVVFENEAKWYANDIDALADKLDSEIEYSSRRDNGLSNREILSMAADELDTSQLSEAELGALRIFQKRLDMLEDLQTQRAEMGREYKDQQFTKGGSRAEAERILSAMKILDSKIKSLENTIIGLENKDVLKSVLEKARTVAEQQERKRGDETLKRYRQRRNESANIRKYRQRVRTEVENLRKWLMAPSNKDVKKHVPAEIQKTVVDFLDSINLMSKKALNSGGLETTKADEKYLKNMRKLRDAIKSNVDGNELYRYAFFTDDFMRTFDALVQKAEEHMSSNSGEYVVNRMSAAELRELSHTLKTLRKIITTMNQFHDNATYQHAYEAGEETIDYLSGFDKSKKSGFLHKFFSFDYMRPSYAFERMGKGGQSIEHEFREGQAVQARLANAIIDFAKKTYTAKEVKEWSEQTKTFDLADGESVTLPITHIMSLYCLNKRAQALTHIYGDGIRVANYKNGRQVQLDEGHTVTIEDVKRMIGSLTERQKAVADALQKYMSTESAAWGNYVSMARFDVEQFTEQNYFPINSDGRYLAATADETPDNAGLYALLNSSFTKELKENASNRIILYNIFDVFANHTASMTQYRAFALPVLDALKWFNYKNDTTSVRTKLSSAFGAPVDERAGSGSKGYAEQFVINLLRAYNGTAAQGDPYDSFGLRALHRFNRAQIAFNFRVVVQQPMAITRAAMMLSPAKLLKGLSMSAANMKKLAAEMEEHSGIAAWKALGFYDTNISRGLTELIKQNPSFGDRVTEFGTKYAETADRFTWAAMWYAAKSSVNRSSYTTEEAYYKAVTELFEDVIYKTQVVDSVLTKSEFLRSKGFFPRAMGAFMSEPMTTTSMLTDAYYKFSDDMQRGMSRSEAWKKNGGNIAKTAAVYTIGQIMLAAAQGVMDAWRDDDEYDAENWLDNFFQKYLNAFKNNVIEELLPFGKIPVLSELYEGLKDLLDYAGVFDKLGLDLYGNDISNGWAQYAKYLKKGAEITIDLIQGNKTNYTPYGAIYNFIRGAAGATGFPIATAWREFQDIWNNTVGYFAPKMKLDTYQRAIDRAYIEQIRPTGLSQKAFEQILEEADERGDGNGSLKQDELGAELMIYLGRGDINEEQAAAVWGSRGWKKTFDEWRGVESKPETTTPAPAPAAPAATAAPSQNQSRGLFDFQLEAPATQAPKVTAAPAEQKPAGITTYQQFRDEAPIYGDERRQASYDVWQTDLRQSGMTLDRYTEILSSADTDGNGSLKQNELGYALYDALDNREMTWDQAAAVWAAQGWKHSFDTWAAKHP